MSELLRNLEHAKLADAWVKKKMTRGSAFSVYDDNWGCVAKVRATTNEAKGDKIAAMAAAAIKGGCGNCAEQARIAFMFLKEKGVRPLDLMELIACDETFVVIGREKNSQLTNYTTWGPWAVICHPWRHAWFKASEYAQRVKGWTRRCIVPNSIVPKLLARLDK